MMFAIHQRSHEGYIDAITIKKCFRNAGILDDFHVVQEKVLEEDAFRDVDPQVQDEDEDRVIYWI